MIITSKNLKDLKEKELEPLNLSKGCDIVEEYVPVEQFIHLQQQNQQLKNRINKLRGENRGLRQTIGDLQKSKKEKQHYKNGKRGTKTGR